MDSYDAADFPQFKQILERQKAILKNAQRFKGQHLVPKKSRYQLIFQFQMRLMTKLGMDSTTNTTHIGTSYIPPSYAPCIKPLCDLKKVMIADLLVETHHRGTHLLLRTITPPNRFTAIMALVEDERGNVVLLQLYEQPEETERLAEDILGEESVVIVKEPYLKIMADGNYGIRVDHLSDIIFLPIGDSRIPRPWQHTDQWRSMMSADNWKTTGNDFFKEEQYFEAIECYTNALGCSPTEEEKDTIKTNRSLAFLNTGQFDAVLSDTASTPKNPSTANKALYRRARALYELQRYEESQELFRTISLGHADNGDVKRYINRIKQRLEEQKTGEYPFAKLYQQAESLRPPHLDYASYTGPVEIRESGSRGRGLFTTEAVKAGDLLLCEKAFAHAFMDDESSRRKMSMMFNIQTNQGFVGAQPVLMQMLAQKLYRNPSVAAAFTDLYHGSYQAVKCDSLVDSVPVVDTFLIERVISLNSFGCPISARASFLKDAMNQASQMKKIEEKEELFHSCGIWIKASHINHSCTGNARRAFIGDMMLIRASRDLEPDTEIMFQYYPHSLRNYKDFRKRMLGAWGFTCDCPLCEDVRATKADVQQKRASLRMAFVRVLGSGGRVKIAKAEALIASLEATYSRPASDVPRTEISDALLAVANVCMEHKQPKKAAELALRAIESLGYSIEGGVPGSSSTKLVVKKWGFMVDDLIFCWLLLADAYRLVAPRLESQARDYARRAYKICIGEDETFEATCAIFV